MKKVNIFAALLALFALQAVIIGCQPSEPPATEPPGETKVGDKEDSKLQNPGTVTPPDSN